MNRLFQKDFWKEIITSLTSNGFRTIITGLCVLWGIFILILLLAASKGLENGVKKSFSGLATNSVFIWAKKTTKNYNGLPKGRQYSFNSKDTESIKNDIKGLKTISPRNKAGGFGGSSAVERGLNQGSFETYGDYPEITEQLSLSLLQGRFINYSDIKDNRKVAVIGIAVKNELYKKDEAVIGTYIKIDGISFKVVGIYNNPNSPGDRKQDDESKIHIPFTTFCQAYNTGDTVRFYFVTAKDGYSITNLKEPIFELLKNNNNIHPEDKRAIGDFDLFEKYNEISSLFIVLTLVSYFVGFLVLISGIIGISNIMLIVIKERTKEIGVRRALGAKPGDIRIQVLTESVFLTLLSGMAGIAMAGLVIFILNFLLDKFAGPDILFINPSVEISTLLISLLLLVLCGLLAGLIPAQTAIKIKPIEALRTE